MYLLKNGDVSGNPEGFVSGSGDQADCRARSVPHKWHVHAVGDPVQTVERGRTRCQISEIAATISSR